MATRDITYQVRDNKGHDVHNVEVKMHEEIVAGNEDNKGICNPSCSNKATENEEDFKWGQFHDSIHVSMATGAPFSVRQQFFVDGGQVEIQFGESTHWSQTLEVRYDAIFLRPDPPP